MIQLRKMTEAEFQHFRVFSIADYAEDLIRGQDLSREQALRDSEENFSALLPDGLDTEGSFLMEIEDPQRGKDVGWIWFFFTPGEDEDTSLVFLSDFLIDEEERRKGYATAALHEMNRIAKAAGCRRSTLCVREHNPGGKSLYETCGCLPAESAEGGICMIKGL